MFINTPPPSTNFSNADKMNLLMMRKIQDEFSGDEDEVDTGVNEQ
jgi:hypothetical protein